MTKKFSAIRKKAAPLDFQSYAGLLENGQNHLFVAYMMLCCPAKERDVVKLHQSKLTFNGGYNDVRDVLEYYGEESPTKRHRIELVYTVVQSEPGLFFTSLIYFYLQQPATSVRC